MLSVYVVAVLVISATVKAETLDLKNEFKKISAEISFMKDRGLLDLQTNGLKSETLNATSQSMAGHFTFSEGFGNTMKVYFVAIPSQAHFEVDMSSFDDVYNIEKEQMYDVEGIVVKQSRPQKPQLMPNLIVTRIKTQR